MSGTNIIQPITANSQIYAMRILYITEMTANGPGIAVSRGLKAQKLNRIEEKIIKN